MTDQRPFQAATATATAAVMRIGAGVEIAAQVAVESFDIAGVNDGDALGHASFSFPATIRAHDGPTTSQTLSMTDSRETVSSSSDAA